MGGSNLVNAAGVYGSLGVESATNQPGARWGAVAFQFGSGNLYMFGGYGVDSNGQLLGYLNDLWTFNPANGRWTWLSGSNTYGATGVYGTKGVAAAGNVPGARSYRLLVADIFRVGFRRYHGGCICAGGPERPLEVRHQYRPVDMGERGQRPELLGCVWNEGHARGCECSGCPVVAWWVWSDALLWIFGGAGYDSVGNGTTDLNDLWRFDPATGHWTWMSGSDMAGPRVCTERLASRPPTTYPARGTAARC